MDEWFYKRGESTYGPIDDIQLRSLVERGRLSHGTLVRRGNSQSWITPDQAASTLPAVIDVESPAFAEGVFSPSDHPAAAAVYAPPRSASILPEPGPPAALRASAAILALWLLFTIIVWMARGLVYMSHVISPDLWPDWLYEVCTQASGYLRHLPHLLITSIKLLSLVVWQCCAFASLRRLYGDSMMQHGPASGFWWCVPIANIFMPVLCLRELRHLSRWRRDSAQSGLPFGRLLWTLQGVILVGVLMSLLGIGLKQGNVDRELMTWFNLCIVAEGIASCIVLLVVVAGNFLQQVRLYHHWNNDGFWLMK